MASQMTYVVLICLLVAPMVSSQATSAPNELNNKDQPPSNSQQNEITDQSKGPSSTDLVSPVPTNQQQYDDTSLEDKNDNNNNNNNNQNQFLRPYDPLVRPFFSLFNGGNLFETIRQHQQNMDRQFEQLRQQAAEGQEVRYFSRNGVSYVRTCTTRRV